MWKLTLCFVAKQGINKLFMLFVGQSNVWLRRILENSILNENKEESLLNMFFSVTVNKLVNYEKSGYFSLRWC